MLDGLAALGDGILLALQPNNLMWALWGCLLGNLVGVLPGIGSAGAIALLLPATAALSQIGRAHV